MLTKNTPQTLNYPIRMLRRLQSALGRIDWRSFLFFKTIQKRFLLRFLSIRIFFLFSFISRVTSKMSVATLTSTRKHRFQLLCIFYWDYITIIFYHHARRMALWDTFLCFSNSNKIYKINCYCKIMSTFNNKPFWRKCIF